jgi:hypothetical protein
MILEGIKMSIIFALMVVLLSDMPTRTSGSSRILKTGQYQEMPHMFASPSQKICSCTPLVYKWKVDFSQTCDYNTVGNPSGPIGTIIGPGQGAEFATCGLYAETGFGGEVDESTSMVPVSIIGYQFIELGQNLQRIKEVASEHDENFVPFADGEILTFDSQFLIDDSEIPRGFIVFLFAKNVDGIQIELQWMVRYSNLCEIPPFEDGDSLGWMVFVVSGM